MLFRNRVFSFFREKKGRRKIKGEVRTKMKMKKSIWTVHACSPITGGRQDQCQTNVGIKDNYGGVNTTDVFSMGRDNFS